MNSTRFESPAAPVMSWRSLVVCALALSWQPVTAEDEAANLRRITSLEDTSEASVHAGQQLISAIYEGCGLTVKFLEAPPARSLSLAEAGRSDGELARVREVINENGPLVALNPPLTLLQLVPIYLDPGIPAQNPLVAVDRIGYINGYRMVPPLLPNGTSTLLAHNTEHLVLLLENNRIDVGLTLGWDAQKAALNNNALIIGEPILEAPVYHYVHRSRVADLPCLSASLTRLKAEGHVDDLLNAILAEQLTGSR